MIRAIIKFFRPARARNHFVDLNKMAYEAPEHYKAWLAAARMQ